MQLGVEVELHVVGNPRLGDECETDYPVVHAHAKGEHQGNIHYVNGHLVNVIRELSDNQLRVGYDATASFGKSIWNGFEITSSPMDLEENCDLWRRLYDNEVMQYFDVDPHNIPRAPAHHSCGMHVHISEDNLHSLPKASDILLRMSRLLSNSDNESFIRYVSGRYATRYCELPHLEKADIEILFHSDDCEISPLIKIDRSEYVDIGYDDDNGVVCCENFREFCANLDFILRCGLNLIPNANTGDIELRLFASPADKRTLLARLEFSHALVVYCANPAGSSYAEFCKWLQSSKDRRGTYRNLFRMLRDQGWVRGLIPRKRGKIE